MSLLFSVSPEELSKIVSFEGDKVIYAPFGVDHPECPYCKVSLAKMPGRKTKCKSCGSYIYKRTRPDGTIVAATENDTVALDTQSHIKGEAEITEPSFSGTYSLGLEPGDIKGLVAFWQSTYDAATERLKPTNANPSFDEVCWEILKSEQDELLQSSMGAEQQNGSWVSVADFLGNRREMAMVALRLGQKRKALTLLIEKACWETIEIGPDWDNAPPGMDMFEIPHLGEINRGSACEIDQLARDESIGRDELKIFFAAAAEKVRKRVPGSPSNEAIWKQYTSRLTPIDA